MTKDSFLDFDFGFEASVYDNSSWKEKASEWKTAFKLLLKCYLRGLSYVEGVKIVGLESKLNNHGRAFVVVEGEQLLIVDGTPEINIYNEYIKLKNVKIPGVKNLKTYKENEFVVFKNNEDCESDLQGIDFMLNKIVDKLDKIDYDAYMTCKRLKITTPVRADKDDISHIKTMWDQGVIVNFSLEKSSKLDPKKAKAGQQAIAPHQIKLEIHDPTSTERKQLWEDEQRLLNKLFLTYGIRYNILAEKEERVPVAEVKQATSLFDMFENERANCRAEGYRELMVKFPNQAKSIKFFYGGRKII